MATVSADGSSRSADNEKLKWSLLVARETVVEQDRVKALNSDRSYYYYYYTPSSPPTGDRLVVAVGLTGSEDLADCVFRNLKGRSLPRVPQSGPQNPAMRVLKSPGTPFRACVRRAVWR